MDHKFQINLRGLIDLLSNHLYSGPEVFVRELLQNGVDAIRARAKVEKGFSGEIAIDVVARKGQPPTLVFADNGIGLTEDEVHTFLATIGESSKRAKAGEPPTDFIGQFGIGLLSCFVVSDEIVVVSRSLKEGTALEWRGRPDGTYTLKKLEADLAPGTQVYLTGKADCEEVFTGDNIRTLAKHFGGLLPYPIRVTAGKSAVVVNEGGAPWRQEFASEKERRRALLAFGREVFEADFLDAIPLKAKAGKVDGVAFVLPHAANLAAKRTHRVYLKNMLLSESADNLLPDWAFFVKAVVNADDLRPTASRESFYEDTKLAAARDALGDCLRQYLLDLAQNRPEKLDKFIELHHLAIRALAVEDDEFYKLFVRWLPFETAQGWMPLGDYLQQNETIRWVPDSDSFRQIARVAAAQGTNVINGGYTYHAELLAKYPDHFDDARAEMVEPAALTQNFEELDLDELEQAHEFLRVAESALKPYRCAADVKKFRPAELPALYSTSQEGRFLRSLEQSKEIADPLWAGVLDSLSRRERSSAAPAQLCFNFANGLVRRLCGVADRDVLKRSVQMLYVQALLLGHHPLSAKELQLLNEGLLALIERGVSK